MFGDEYIFVFYLIIEPGIVAVFFFCKNASVVQFYSNAVFVESFSFFPLAFSGMPGDDVEGY